MLHFEPDTLIRRSTENSEVSVTQSEKGESTGLHQSQGLIILAKVGQPKLTVSSVLIFEVFDSRVAWSQVDIPGIVFRLAGIFDSHTKV